MSTSNILSAEYTSKDFRSLLYHCYLENSCIEAIDSYRIMNVEFLLHHCDNSPYTFKQFQAYWDTTHRVNRSGNSLQIKNPTGFTVKGTEMKSSLPVSCPPYPSQGNFSGSGFIGTFDRWYDVNDDPLVLFKIENVNKNTCLMIHLDYVPSRKIRRFDIISKTGLNLARSQFGASVSSPWSSDGYDTNGMKYKVLTK